MKIRPVIMAGGLGTRLWPLSRQLYPKQFVKIFDNISLLQNTLMRNQSLGKITLIVGQEHESIAIKQVQAIGLEIDLIVEPTSKNTASCAIIAALQAKNQGCDTVILLPSDHYISNDTEYIMTIHKSLKYIEQFGICTIGIRPYFPNIEYGYMEIQEPIANDIYKIRQFIEKPTLIEAENYLKQGNYFWNSGIFIYNVDFILSQAKLLHAKLFDQLYNSFHLAIKNNHSIKLSSESYLQIEAISIDHAIMEYISPMIMVEGNFKWCDLGNWQSLWQIRKKDVTHNYCEGDIIVNDTTNSYISSSDKLIVVIGIDNIIIINTDDALLVANKSKAAEVKQIVTQMTKCDRKEVR